jgi:hypothetical protein
MIFNNLINLILVNNQLKIKLIFILSKILFQKIQY